VTPTPEQIAADRERLCERYPMALLIASFVADDTRDSLEVVYADSSTVLDDGTRFLDIPNFTEDSAYQHIYTMARRGHWLKTEVWVTKRGRSTWLFKSEDDMKAKRKEWRKKR